jgi:alpha-glucosidase
MDYTPGIFDLQNSVKRMATTLARQLAYYVTIYSGMTMAADRPFMYEERFPEEFKFIRDVPNNYEKTIPLAGEIGEYYVVARKGRGSEDWYIGGVTNEYARTVVISLEFLDAGAYLADIYADSEDAHYRDNPFGITISHKTLGSADTLRIHLAPGGGFAIRLHKE